MEQRDGLTMKYVFILNPIAGKNDAGSWLEPAVRQASEAAGVRAIVERTTHPGHARELAARYAASGEPVRLYACGGDGTLNEVLQGAAGCPQASIGCVPCGSGNDYVRNFGAPEQFLDIPAQLQARPVPMDALDTSFGIGVDIFAAGLDAQVAYGIPRFRRLPGCGGTMAYTLSILQALFSSFGHRLRVDLDGKAQTGTYMMLAICNGRLYGGGYNAAPYALMDDGLLDVVLVRPMSRLKIASVLAVYKKGGHLAPDGSVVPELRQYISFHRVRRAEVNVMDGRPIIATLDGECAPVTRLYAQAAPGLLSMLLPPAVCGDPKTLCRFPVPNKA